MIKLARRNSKRRARDDSGKTSTHRPDKGDGISTTCLPSRSLPHAPKPCPSHQPLSKKDRDPGRHQRVKQHVVVLRSILQNLSFCIPSALNPKSHSQKSRVQFYQASMDLSFELAALGKSAVDAAHRSPDKVGRDERLFLGLE